MNIWCYVVLLITIALRSTCYLTDSTPRTEWRSGRNSAVHLNTVNNQVSGAKRPLQITLSVHRQGRRRPLAHWLTDRWGRPQDQGNDELVNKKKASRKYPTNSIWGVRGKILFVLHLNISRVWCRLFWMKEFFEPPKLQESRWGQFSFELKVILVTSASRIQSQYMRF